MRPSGNFKIKTKKEKKMSTEQTNIREPAVAGQFYTADPVCLQAEVADMLDGEVAKSAGKVRALISPHAGYTYSGKTAAKGFALLKGCEYRRIVVIAPSHRVPFFGIATADYTAYKTPLGNLSIDRDSVSSIIETGQGSVMELTQAHVQEHSLEVQLPFLQEVLSDVPIIPLVCGQLNADLAEKTAKALLPLWNSDTLWVISSDFTHFGHSFGYVPFSNDIEHQLKELDMGAVAKILALDFEGFSDYIEETGATICGTGPIKILLKTIELANCADSITPELLECTNSGEISGDFSHCVGYSSIAFSEKN